MIPKTVLNLATFAILVALVFLLLEAFFGSPRAHAAVNPGVRLSATPLGVNVSPRQPIGPQAVINAQLKNLGPVEIRYGGGTLADGYWYNLNKDTYSCAKPYIPDPSRSCARYDSLNLATIEAGAASIGADVMPIVNYGSGSAALAANMARDSTGSKSVEIGNEPYGCGFWISKWDQPPMNDTSETCPYALYGSVANGLAQMGTSYNAYAPGFVSAIRHSRPDLKIELPYAISPPGNSGYVWNHKEMPALKGQYDGIVVLSYPFYNTGSIPDNVVLNSVRNIPARAAEIKADIRKYSPGVTWQIGETNAANHNNVANCRPAGGVYAAANALAWLSQGASNVNWWDESDPVNTSACVNPDFGMFSATGVAQPPYWGYVMASKLAQPNAKLQVVATGNANFLEFHSFLPNGHQAVAYVNLSTTVKAHFKAYPFANANLPVYTYGASGHITSTHVPQKVFAKNGITLSPASVVVVTR